MTERFRIRPSEIPDGHYIVAVCQACHEHRYITRALMLEKAGDVPLSRIEPRLRCIARPRADKRGQACGGRMVMEWRARRVVDPDWAVG
ncbi:hypothetical protein [Brevundimonas sp.]|uniref:hypothetical protein n=1 Tax=Brevundimonas sp. TaxID=1871086 RepID=UPI0027E93801|nr:hypothetical protein [Brevundimonas sp.]MDQ7813878.1 hypothetical protein [Brevundimonas sp.]